MKKIKILIPFLILTFLRQNILFGIPDSNFTLRPPLYFTKITDSRISPDEETVNKTARIVMATALQFTLKMMKRSDRASTIHLLKSDSCIGEYNQMIHKAAHQYLRYNIALHISELLRNILGNELISVYILEEDMTEGLLRVSDSVKITIYVTNSANKQKIIGFIADLDKQLLTAYKGLLGENSLEMKFLIQASVINEDDAKGSLKAGFLRSRSHDCGQHWPEWISIRNEIGPAVLSQSFREIIPSILSLYNCL